MTVPNDIDIHIQPLIAEAYQRLADTLARLPEAAADSASLCEGWTVRNVLAHMTMAVRYSTDEFMAQLRDADFDFGRLSNLVAQRDGALPFEELRSDLRSETMAQWIPPGGGSAGALNHVAIHGLDITVALGLPRSASDEAMLLVLESLTAGGTHRYFDTNIDGLRLHASDLDWTYGAGRTVEASAQDIAVALCGRRISKIPDLRLREQAHPGAQS